jgi:hypothetical protein
MKMHARASNIKKYITVDVRKFTIPKKQCYMGILQNVNNLWIKMLPIYKLSHVILS